MRFRPLRFFFQLALLGVAIGLGPSVWADESEDTAKSGIDSAKGPTVSETTFDVSQTRALPESLEVKPALADLEGIDSSKDIAKLTNEPSEELEVSSFIRKNSFMLYILGLSLLVFVFGLFQIFRKIKRNQRRARYHSKQRQPLSVRKI